MKNNLGTAVIAAVVALLVVGISFTFIKPVQNVVNQTLGANAGPDSYFPCESHNGVTQCFARQPLRAATTTVCALKSPSATSTLIAANATFRVASSTSAVTVDLAKATTPYATTTSLGTAGLASGAQGSFNASTTNQNIASVDNAHIFGPNTWFVVGVRSGITGGDASGVPFQPAGACNATFQVI